ncbi:MAG: GNAT family N-acetyltransferase [Oligoflexia bacterium]
MRSRVLDTFYLSAASFFGVAGGGLAGAVGALAISGLSAFALKRVGMEMQWLQVAASGAAGGAAGTLLLRAGMLAVRRLGWGRQALERFVIYLVLAFAFSLLLGGAVLYVIARGSDGAIGPRLFTVIGWMVGLLAAGLPLGIRELLVSEPLRSSKASQRAKNEVLLFPLSAPSGTGGTGAKDLATLQALHALNQSEVPHVGDLDFETFEKLVLSVAQHVWVARSSASEILGFIVVMNEDAPYSSVNFQWFKARYDRFLYVDRLAVAKGARKQGVGRLMVERVIEQARFERRDFVTCEVNVVPPNPDSMAFHTTLGFLAIGEQDTEGGKKRVRLLGKSAT